MDAQNSPPPPAPPADEPTILGFLDENKTYITSAIVAAVTYLFPPAQAILQADPQLAVVLVTGLFAALHTLAKGPGLLRK